MAGSLAKKSHAAPLIGARARAVSVVFLTRSSCFSSLGSRVAGDRSKGRARPQTRLSPRDRPLSAISAARTARSVLRGGFGAVARTGRPVAFGLQVRNQHPNAGEVQNNAKDQERRAQPHGWRRQHVKFSLAQEYGIWDWLGLNAGMM